MKTSPALTSACRCCRYYNPEGRRGGMCQQLSAPVQGTWKACSLAIPAFATYSRTLKKDIVLLEHSLALDCSADYPSMEISEFKTVPVEKVKSC